MIRQREEWSSSFSPDAVTRVHSLRLIREQKTSRNCLLHQADVGRPTQFRVPELMNRSVVRGCWPDVFQDASLSFSGIVYKTYSTLTSSPYYVPQP